MTCSIEDYAVAYLREPVLLSFARLPIRAVCTARPTGLRVDPRTAGPGDPQCRFMGLFTSSVYNEASTTSPFIRARSPK